MASVCQTDLGTMNAISTLPQGSADGKTTWRVIPILDPDSEYIADTVSNHLAQPLNNNNDNTYEQAPTQSNPQPQYMAICDISYNVCKATADINVAGCLAVAAATLVLCMAGLALVNLAPLFGLMTVGGVALACLGAAAATLIACLLDYAREVRNCRIAKNTCAEMCSPLHPDDCKPIR